MAKKDEKLRRVLTTWRSLMASITTLSEEDAQKALQLEQQGARRKDIMLRLYGRYSRMRSEREIRDLLGD